MSTMLHTPFDELQVIRLGRFEWRVTDAASPDTLLGFIERQRADRFEIVWMSDPIRWGYAASFDSALVAFGDSLRFIGDVYPKREANVDRPTGSLGTGAYETPRSTARLHRATWTDVSDETRIA